MSDVKEITDLIDYFKDSDGNTFIVENRIKMTLADIVSKPGENHQFELLEVLILLH